MYPLLFAMAPKARRAFGPKTVSARRVGLDDISVADDSGWRAEDSERVAELVAMIKALYLG